jgi:PPM family protein phosphatase
MRMLCDCAGATDRGRVRESNEDHFLVADLIKSVTVRETSLPVGDYMRQFAGLPGKLLVVADGMGGHAGGRRASSLAIETLAKYVLNTMHWFFRLQENREDDLVEELKAALFECQAAIGAAAATEAGRERMGTTLTLAYVLWPRAYVIHAGDSRCYLHRGGRLRRVTRDHTMAQKLVDEGVWTKEEAAESKWNHVLWSCINNKPDSLHPDVHRFHLEAGDSLLLCTDGLTRHVTDDGIAAELARVPQTAAADVVKRLVAAANEAGGADNITVVAGHFRPDGSSSQLTVVGHEP